MSNAQDKREQYKLDRIVISSVPLQVKYALEMLALTERKSMSQLVQAALADVYPEIKEVYHDIVKQ